MSMTETRPIVRPESAQVGRTAGGVVVFDDPGAPWVVRVKVVPDGPGRSRLDMLRVDVRPGGQPISRGGLARLPLHVMHHIASVMGRPQAEPHPNETYYRLLAQPKPHGQRQWDAGHWGRVLAVYDWARATGRPGGPAEAVAELWEVAVNPTVYRWLAEARRRVRTKQ